jgi:hypothetical protein
MWATERVNGDNLGSKRGVSLISVMASSLPGL